MKFLVTMERDEAGYYVVECPTLPGCVSQGRTEAEATANIKSAIDACIQARRELGLPLAVEIREVEVEVAA